MAKEYAEKFYKSNVWEQCRAGYIATRITIDGGLCERCQRNPGYIVHHKIWLDAKKINDVSIALSADNLEYLCQDCHNQEHHSRNKPLLCMFDEKGRPTNGNA